MFNKGLVGKDKKEGLLKRLKNIEDKNEELLKIIRDKTDRRSQVNIFDEELTSWFFLFIIAYTSINYTKIKKNKNIYKSIHRQ